VESHQRNFERDLTGQRAAWGLFAATMLAVAIAVSPNGADPDLWGHVQYGRDVFQEGLPATATYTYTAPDHRWINHENLSELTLAVAVDTIGPVGLLIVKALLGLAICAVPFWKARSFATSPVPVLILALLISLNLTNHWNVRPQLFSFGFFALMLLGLDWTFQQWQGHWNLPWIQSARRGEPWPNFHWCHQRMRWLWLCVPFFVVWTNCHGGFAAGLAVFIAYMACRMLEAASSYGRKSAGILKRLTLMCVVAALATLLNPYSTELHGWMISALGVPRPEITEWHPLYSMDMFSVVFLLLVAIVIGSLAASRRPLDFTQAVVLGLVLMQAIAHQRHIPFFAMLCAFWVTPHLVSAWERLFIEKARNQPEPINPHAILAIVIAGLVILSAPLFQRLSTMKVQHETYPVSAIYFMAKHDLHGRTVVTYNWAQYFIAARCAEGKSSVQFDGRYRTCYPQSVVDQHFDFILGDIPDRRWRESPDPVEPSAALNAGLPDLVLIDRGQPHSVQTMQLADDWVLLYQDSLAQVWGVAAVYDRPDSPEYLHPDLRQITDTLQQGFTHWPAIPSSESIEIPHRLAANEHPNSDRTKP